MKKIVINKCYGGFSLSYKGVMLYAKLKKFKLHAFVNKQVGKLVELTPKMLKESQLCKLGLIHYSKENLTKAGKLRKDSYFSCRDIPRDDPILIKVVEKLGKEANGECASLEVVSIPEGVDWKITEYDGMESVEEKHRSWG